MTRHRFETSRGLALWPLGVVLLIASAADAAAPWVGVSGFAPADGEIPTNAVVYVLTTGLIEGDLVGGVTFGELDEDALPTPVDALEDLPCGPNYLDYPADCLTRATLGDLRAGSTVFVNATLPHAAGDSVSYSVGEGPDTSAPRVLGLEASAYYDAGGERGTTCNREVDPHFSVRFRVDVEDDDRVVAFAVRSHPDDVLIRVGRTASIQEAPTPGERCYRVVAIDAAGNESAPSEPVCVELTIPPDAEPLPCGGPEPGVDVPLDGGPGADGGGHPSDSDGPGPGEDGTPDPADEPEGGCAQASGPQGSALVALGALLLAVSRRRRA